MTDQTIPADRVRELADKYDQDSSGNPERLLVQAIADLRALLPTPQPTSGLLGRWAKHDAYGDVVVISDHPGDLGDVWVSHTDTGEPDGATCDHVPLADLTFPECPESDLQAKYDELEQKYAELDRKYFDLGVELAIEQQASGWGDEQPEPAWRIEHDHTNLRVGEYIIDKDGDTGTVTYRFGSTEWATDGDARGTDDYAPFIVFPNRDAVTPEAVAEAKKARDKETGE